MSAAPLPLYALTLRYPHAPLLSLRPALQAIAAAPALPGLRARHWLAERDAVRGRYLFDDRAHLDAFARDPSADPALALFADQADMPPLERGPVEAIPADDIFDRPVIIIAAPRAGSTLLYELLAQARGLWSIGAESHGVIEGVPQLHVASRGFDSHRLTDLDLDPETARVVRAGFLAELRDHRGRRYLDLPPAQRPARVRLLEKTPENTLRLPFLRALFPDVRLVFLHRDARQNVSSMIEAWQHDGFVRIPALPGWARERWCLLLPPGWRAMADADVSDLAAFQWQAANEQVLSDLAAEPRERWIDVDYSDLVAAPQVVVRRVCGFCAVEMDGDLDRALDRPLPLSSTTITPPSPIKWRNNRALRASSLAGLGPLMGRLRNLSTPPPPPPRPRKQLTRVRFSCFLDQLEPELAHDPDALLSDEPEVVSPGFCFQRGATVPLALVRRARFRERFLSDYPLLWNEDPATLVLYPFWARREHVWLFDAFEPGQPPPSSLDPGLAERLRHAGVLTTRGAVARRCERGQAMFTRARDELERERYCTLPGLLQRAYVAALAQYYRALVDTGEWALGDGQVERRHGWHDEPLARYLHHQLIELVSGVAGEPVKPSYCYASAYRGGAALHAHLDRRQCEYTMSVLVDHSSGQYAGHMSDAESAPWPLWFQAPGGKRSVTLALGDAVLFRGCELPHWREAAPPDWAQTMLLFHYVPMSFVGVLD
ncbi:sulfotransferase [Haliangium sp.]|uniref:sulfotransferase n=1 Tax=Haliangium sp. TaxID=2663208 RepID=UPI003D0CE54F